MSKAWQPRIYSSILVVDSLQCTVVTPRSPGLEHHALSKLSSFMYGRCLHGAWLYWAMACKIWVFYTVCFGRVTRYALQVTRYTDWLYDNYIVGYMILHRQ